MIKLKTGKWLLLASLVSEPALFSACTTDDVLAETPEDRENLIEISDAALGQYLVYNSLRTDDERLPARTAVEIDGKYYLDIDKASTVDNLYLVKNETQINKLSNAGLSTADQKISDMTILPYFTALRTLKLTSNEVGELDITNCPLIETIEMNNNMVASLDLSNATNLKRLRYGSNNDAQIDKNCQK